MSVVVNLCLFEFDGEVTQQGREKEEYWTLKHYLLHPDEQTCVRSVSHDEEHDTFMTGDNECEGNNYRNRERH